MNLVEIDEETHRFLLQNTSYVGETEAAILRRLLGIGNPGKIPTSMRSDEQSALEAHLGSLGFKHANDAVSRFLSILGLIYREHANDFDKVENIRGRGRLYFAKDAAALRAAGRSVSEKQIPGSPYWATTNSPTFLKQEILANVMKAFNYGEVEIAKATSSIAERSVR